MECFTTISQLQSNRLDFTSTFLSFQVWSLLSVWSQTLPLCLHLLLEYQLTTDIFF